MTIGEYAFVQLSITAMAEQKTYSLIRFINRNGTYLYSDAVANIVTGYLDDFCNIHLLLTHCFAIGIFLQ